jgi:hypothetical protein
MGADAPEMREAWVATKAGEAETCMIFSLVYSFWHANAPVKLKNANSGCFSTLHTLIGMDWENFNK